MNKLLFVVLSQLRLKSSRFPQNGLVWVQPVLPGRFGDSLELCSSQVWQSELCSTSGQVMMMCQRTTDRQDIVLGPMVHLQSWSNDLIIIFTCAHFKNRPRLNKYLGFTSGTPVVFLGLRDREVTRSPGSSRVMRHTRVAFRSSIIDIVELSFFPKFWGLAPLFEKFSIE